MNIKIKIKKWLLLELILILFFTACNPGSVDINDTSDVNDDPVTEDQSGAIPEITEFTLSGACGYDGDSSVSFSAITVGEYSGWEISNNNWNSAPVFTFSTAAADLGEYAGLICRIQAKSSLSYKTFSLELPSSSGFTALGQGNTVVSSTSTYNLTQDTEKVFYLDFADLAADSGTGVQEIALGISAPADSSYYIYDIRLIPPEESSVFWAEADSLKDAWEPEFGYLGIAVEKAELLRDSVQAGLVRNASGITMGNAMKPDYILGSEPISTTTFTAQDTNTYTVPASLNFTDLDSILTICAENNLEMRGHVLVWHAQSPAWFFREGFNASGAYVDADTMNARLEWYIKTVLEYVKDWEITNNSGNRIITTWDVVNEAVSDSATATNWLRGSNGEASDWYEVYGNADFITNAFKYANLYAPADVLLAYNDYNSYMSHKTTGIIALINAVQGAEGTRLDVMGMQSHVTTTYPGVNSHKTALQAFLAEGIDVEVTELDIKTYDNSDSGQSSLASLYADYFNMFQSLKKTTGSNGVKGVTIWGLRDTTSWLSGPEGVTYPLLLDGWFYTKPSWDAVINAAN